MTIIYACTRLADLPQCRAPGCSGRAAYKCEYPLRGKKAGQVCGKPLCTSHTVVTARGVERTSTGGKPREVGLCEGHARMPWPDCDLCARGVVRHANGTHVVNATNNPRHAGYFHPCPTVSR